MRPAATTVELHAHVAAAAYLMRAADASALVIISDDESHAPLAIFTDSDIARVVADGRDVNDTRISDLVGTTPLVTDGATSISDAADYMLRTGADHLPVVDDGRLVGILGMRDVCKALLDAPATAR
jgi:CBS domain-containing protein